MEKTPLFQQAQPGKISINPANPKHLHQAHGQQKKTPAEAPMEPPHVKKISLFENYSYSTSKIHASIWKGATLASRSPRRSKANRESRNTGKTLIP
jgi:hypothetical protein